jgi:hypothetical protein
MSDKYEVTTRSGWRGELRVVEEKGSQVVKVALYIRPRLLSPFFEVDRFTTTADATKYAQGIKDALEGTL